MNEKCFLEMELMLDIMNECGSVDLPVQGKSMRPFLKAGRDSVQLVKPDGQFKKGDIVVYRRNDKYLLHRIVAVGTETVSIAGDNEFQPETGIDRGRIVAVVSKVRRDGKVIDKNDIIWKFYSKVYINMCVRKTLVKANKMRRALGL